MTPRHPDLVTETTRENGIVENGLNIDNLFPDNNTEQRTDVPGEARVKHDIKECINTIIQ